MIFNIISLAIVANLITHWFEPLQGIKNRILLFINSKVLTTVLTCPKCLGFYIGIVFSLTQPSTSSLIFLISTSILFGATVSFCSYLIKFIIDKIEYDYES